MNGYPETFQHPLFDSAIMPATELPSKPFQINDSEDDYFAGVLAAKPGEVIVYWLPGKYSYYSSASREFLGKGAKWENELAKYSDMWAVPLMVQIYKLLFPALAQLKVGDVLEGLVKRVTP